MNFHVEMETADWARPALIFKLRGQLDSMVIQDLERALQEAARDHEERAWVFDLSGLEYVSSAGVAVFIGLRYAREKNGGLCFCGITDKVAAVFTTLCLDDVFATYSNLDQAREGLGG